MRHDFWMLAATNRNQEWRAAYHAEVSGFKFYLPQIRSSSGGREFLFPGYLFVQLRRGWEILIHARGFRRIFLTNEEPWKIRGKELDVFRRREDSHGIVCLQSRFRLGERVVIQKDKDLFNGYVGIFNGDTPERRCRILLEMLGRHVPVMYDESYLELAA
jgi:hypothetical protein